MEDGRQPLLSPPNDHQNNRDQHLRSTNSSIAASFALGSGDIPLINSYSLGGITQLLAGHVGTLDLAAVSVENSVIAGFSFGIMLGMGSALETLCGTGLWSRAAGHARNLHAKILEISQAAGVFSVWMIPQLFAYAINFPIAKFLQAQSKMMVMAVIAAVALVFHAALSWLLMLKLGWGLVGAAVVLNGSWWFIVIAQLLYIFSGTCGEAWTGFSWKAFQNLWGFVKVISGISRNALPGSMVFHGTNTIRWISKKC
ncbi:PROTEIN DETOXIFICATION 31 [Salix purpurea]|uniref:PROTEIN DETOXIFICATION 31 n=1 Tax=Salix purpurea TaxID=77065 RepID=A0A9Q0U940_SALPP|nr:PROTEIN DETOXIFICATION 31 [Salix purpurea]